MNKKNTLTDHQLVLLTRFVSKHEIDEIKLNQAESRYFFDFLDQGKLFDYSRILLEPVIAEGVIEKSNEWEESKDIIIIPKFRLLRSKKIRWEDGFDKYNVHTNPFTRRLFEIFVAKMGYEVLFDKIATELKNRYPLSQGQAKALIQKHLGFKLTSGTRSFLHDLRNKIRKYQELIINFQEYVVLPQDDVKLTPQTFAEELKTKFSSGEITDFLDKSKPTERISRKEMIMNEFSKQHNEIVKNIEMLKIEKRYYLQDPPNYAYYCLSCGETKPINEDQLENDNLIRAPQHCEKSMIIKIQQKTL